MNPWTAAIVAKERPPNRPRAVLHSSERPPFVCRELALTGSFRCPVCQKTYSRKQSLKTHYRELARSAPAWT